MNVRDTDISNRISLHYFLISLHEISFTRSLFGGRGGGGEGRRVDVEKNSYENL